ncbi:MAG: SDR family NAD(P)-dependent oxidoreductase [candidate division NC10 bacterium]|nr:SDR family NAD(P)-dependent oxidoreductase [candidate division NC10 bacterium]
MPRFQDGTLSPLPYRVFPISNAAGAFRHMAQAKHTGKVVLSLQEWGVSIAPPSDGKTTFRDDATYLITGGLGGFGLIIAQWMVEHGARHIVLMGRRGAHSLEAQERVEAMRRAGVEVVVEKADVGSPEQVARVLGHVETSMPPLRGVLHAAMVLRDSVVLNLNEERMREVWRPKVRGAWNLHTQTLNDQLDFFILFSSSASVFGMGGQGNYASANAFLDSLAYRRRARGLPGTSISWGALGEAGWLARHGDIAERLEAFGLGRLTPTQALTLLGHFMRTAPPHVAVMRIDWAVLGENAPISISPRFAHLVRKAAQGDAGLHRRGGDTIRNALLAAKPSERLGLTTSLLREQVARVLGASPAKLDIEKPLTEMGLDSLMGVELRNWVEGELRLSVPILELMRGPSVVRLAELLVNQLSQPENAPSSPNQTREETPEQVLANVDQLSHKEVESLLSDMMSEATQETQREGESSRG